MSATETLPPKARWYLDEVRRALADLPESERDELLGDVETHVAEVALETGDELLARLGSPGTFASELRSAAGLPADPPPAMTRARLEAAARRLRGRLPSPAPLADLAPAWWVLRGYVAAVLLGVLVGDGLPDGWLPQVGSEPVSFAVLLATVAGSVWLGRRTRGARLAPMPRAALATANALGVVAAVLVAANLPDQGYAGATYIEPDVVPGLAQNGQPVENVYAFDREGKPLSDVRLYDQFGQPLAILPGSEDPTRRAVVDARGKRADNAVPLRYVDPATGEVTDPEAGIPTGVAPLITPPLGDRPPRAEAPSPRKDRKRERDGR